MVNRPKVRTNQFQGSEIGLKVGTRTGDQLRDGLAPYSPLSQEMEIRQMHFCVPE